MTAQPISVTLPVSQAIDRVKGILFQPFDLGKWFAIGFCAWLAMLGEGGGGGLNFRFPGRSDRNVHHEFNRAREFVMDNLYWILPVAIAVVAVSIALWVLFVWLSSRGRFMFLHCVALDKAEVSVPWNKFAREGTSLFWFRMVLGLIGLVVTLPVLALGGVMVVRMAVRDSWSVPGVLGVVGLGLVFLALAIVLAIVGKFTTDFVVPIMFLRRKGCLDAWSEFGDLLKANVGQMILYLLFQIVLGIAIGVLVLLVVLVTCCVAVCLMAIPYLGTVLLLPVLVFKRAYSLYYLSQYGAAYDVFPRMAPASAPPA